MPHNRFFTQEKLFSHQHLVLQEDEAHHMRDVMRATVGDLVELVNGNGQIAEASILSISKKEVLLEVTSLTEVKRPHTIITTALPLLRPAHFDWAIEKVLELGVDQLYLFPADLSERKDISENTLRRVHKIAESAMKQSGSIFLPSISIYSSLQNLLTQIDSPILWAEQSTESVSILSALDTPPSSLILLTGPEKGWSIAEKKLLQTKATPVLLSDRTLRAETAAIALAAFATVFRSMLPKIM